MLKRIILSIFIAVIFLVPSIAESSAERDITKQTLPNGLKVIIEEDHSAPVVALQFWVHVGSADEKENEAGVAHVFEHMLFKGTEKRGLGDIAREVEASGGSINAYTSYDNTVYHIVMPSRRFAVGLDILSDAIRNSSFDPNELAKELEVVLEEIRMGEDNPGRKLFKSLLSNAYTTHPYKDTVIGYNETVSALTRDYILEFFDKWYRPENMTLVIT
ncbi:MAG: insulinase family protein, partial [Deltaproteobacteria bacterium]|nr:insulinase family protein [Deltaproteobacteria bacterium]